jgi:hypothetical protein
MGSAFEEIRTLSGEGGPPLLADQTVILAWRGGEAEGEDYERACTLLQGRATRAGCAIEIGGGAGFLWDVGGPGTADISAVKKPQQFRRVQAVTVAFGQR